MMLAALGLLGACAPAPGLPEEAPRLEAPVRMGFEPEQAVNLSQAPRTVEVLLGAVPRLVSLGDNLNPMVLTYNGHYPGPTIEVQAGDRLIVRFENQLSDRTGLHWAGLAEAALVAPAERRIYTYDVPKGGPGALWYHPPLEPATREQVGQGLLGAIRVLDDADPLPRSYGDTLAVLSETTSAGKPVPLVNGWRVPTLTLHPGEVRRVRLLNASVGREHQLVLESGRWTVIGSETGRLERPVEQEVLTLAPGASAEVLLTGPAAGRTVAVSTRMPDETPLFVVSGEGEAEMAEPLPETLR